MEYEVKWTYWFDDEGKHISESKMYTSLSAASDKYEYMKGLSHIDYVGVAVIVEKFSR